MRSQTSAGKTTYQHDAVDLEAKVDGVQENYDSRYHNLAKSDYYLPEVKINVVAMCQEIESTVSS